MILTSPPAPPVIDRPAAHEISYGVVSGVAVALLRTREAGDRTGFDHCADDAQIRRCLARHDTAGRVAGVCAVEAETNAANHLPHVILGKIGIRTTRAAGGAVEALRDTAQKRLAIDDRSVWVQLNDLSKRHVSPFIRAAATDTAGNSADG